MSRACLFRHDKTGTVKLGCDSTRRGDGFAIQAARQKKNGMNGRPGGHLKARERVGDRDTGRTDAIAAQAEKPTQKREKRHLHRQPARQCR
jgi:hypothetical protein